MSQPISSPPSSALLSAAMTSARTYALALMPVFPRPVARLLISSFVFVLGRAVALPFMVLYLTRHLGLTQNQVGWILGGSIMVATVSGLYSGFLVDRISKQKLMSVACLMVALCSLLLSVAAYALAAFAMLSLIEAALVLRSVSLKAMLADFLPPAKRTRAFSMNYLLINLAFALGPVLGAYAYGVQISSPLWLSAGFALLATWVVNAKSAGIASALAAKESPVIASPARTSFSDTLHDLKSDRRLILFTLGSVLTSFVFGRFISGYLAQYLLISRGVRMATELIPVILMTNAVGVVVLQYAIGKRIQHQHLFAWVCVGVLLYVAGLLGFMHAYSRWSWIVSTAIFTVGEVIVIPVEYMFIDMIAPEGKRGSYYGAQGLCTLGTALNPVICGFLLTHFQASLMFWVLIAAAVSGVLMYYAGTRQRNAPGVLTAELVAEVRSEEVQVVQDEAAELAISAARTVAGNRVQKLYPLS